MLFMIYYGISRAILPSARRQAHKIRTSATSVCGSSIHRLDALFDFRCQHKKPRNGYPDSFILCWGRHTFLLLRSIKTLSSRLFSDLTGTARGTWRTSSSPWQRRRRVSKIYTKSSWKTSFQIIWTLSLSVLSCWRK